MGSGSAAHQAAKCRALHSIRGTQSGGMAAVLGATQARFCFLQDCSANSALTVPQQK
jgi:hypothetical protein